MKTYIFTNITVLFSILISVAFASAQEPKNVTDYLLTLPAKFFEYVEPGYVKYQKNKPTGKAAIEEYRRSKIETEDIKNGFLRYKQYSEEDHTVEIALFKKTSGKYLMAINRVGAYKGCHSTLNFIEYNGGTWLDVTKRYVLKLNKSEAERAKTTTYCYELPQQGRTVRIFSKWWAADPDETWGYFDWDGEKFNHKL